VRLNGEARTGSAVRKLVTDALMMAERRELGHLFVTGEWSADLSVFEERREREKTGTRELRTLRSE
jgi:hypothetical protein